MLVGVLRLRLRLRLPLRVLTEHRRGLADQAQPEPLRPLGQQEQCSCDGCDCCPLGGGSDARPAAVLQPRSAAWLARRRAAGAMAVDLNQRLRLS